MTRLRSTLLTVAHRSPMLLAGSVSGWPHSKWWWCHDTSSPLLAAEHSPCKAPWSGTPCRTTSAHSRTMSPLDSAWKPGFSLPTSVLSALEISWQLRYINSHLPLPLVLVQVHVPVLDLSSPTSLQFGLGTFSEPDSVYV